MNNDKENNKDITITTNYQLWQILLADQLRNKKHKFTKCEAFYDILKRQRIVCLSSDSTQLSGGYEQLATTWSWSRNAVVHFIDQLVQHHYASRFTKGNKVLVVLNNINGLPELPPELLNGTRASIDAPSTPP